MADFFMYCFSVVLLCEGMTNLRLSFHCCGLVIWNGYPGKVLFFLFTKKDSSLQNVIPCGYYKRQNNFHTLSFRISSLMSLSKCWVRFFFFFLQIFKYFWLNFSEGPQQLFNVTFHCCTVGPVIYWLGYQWSSVSVNIKGRLGTQTFWTWNQPLIF